MVSVKRCTLPSEYIEAANKLVSALEGHVFFTGGVYHTTNNGNGYYIEYAFFDLIYGEDEEWTDGSWWLYIATNSFSHDSDGVGIVLHLLKLLNIDLPEFYFEIIKPDWENDKHRFNRVDVNEYNKI